MKFLSNKERVITPSIGWLIKAAPIILLAIMATRMVTSMTTINPTIDEPVHLTSGYSYLKTGDFRLNPEHPSLFKIIAAFPLLFTNVRFDTADQAWVEGRQWDLAQTFVFHNTLSPDTIIFLGRLPTVLITLVLGYLIYRFASELFGRRGGLFSLFLFTFDPNIIAHGQLVTNDIFFSLGAVLSTYTFLTYLKQPSKRNLVIASSALGFALLTKFSALFLPLSFGLMAIVWFILKKKRLSLVILKKAALHALTFALISGAMIWLSYGFEIRNAITQEPEFVPALRMITSTDQGIGKFAYSTLERVSVPALSYLEGIVVLAVHNKYGHLSYLLGNHSGTGWWYYFPVAILVKTPIAIFLFGAIAAYVLRKKKFISPRLDTITVIGLALPPIVHLLLAMSGKINLGLRHVIVIYPFAYILLGLLMNVRIISLAKLKQYQFALAIPALYLVVTSTLIFPHYLSYFNELSGGPKNGWQFLLDSNIDWGQDIKNLRIWMQERKVESIYLQQFGTSPAEVYGISFKPVPKIAAYEALKEPLSGYAVISLSDLFNKNDDFSWLRKQDPVDRIGYSMWVYDLGKIQQSKPTE